MYDRNGVATRVVEIFPQECWAVEPNVFETQDKDSETEFEKAWSELGNKLRGESHFKEEEEGNPIWEYLLRADILSGIGHFGVILLGLNDGKELSEEVEPSDKLELTYIRCFDEALIKVSSYETDETNPRYSQPNTYNLTLEDYRNRADQTALHVSTVDVHWTRVVHLADNLGSSEHVGVPRMRPVWDRLYDLYKLYGGSAEMYWRGAFPGLSFETNPQAGNTKLNVEDLRDKAEDYMNSLQRYLITKNMNVKSIAPQVVDPSAQVNTQIDAICIKIGVPKRIFIGSERGELASGQDADTWDKRLVQRQHKYITPRIIIPFIDTLINLKVLPKPKEGFGVEWPSMSEPNDTERAELASKRTEVLAKYIQGSVDTLITPMDFLVRELNYTEEEAEEILKAAEEQQEEEPEEGEFEFDDNEDDFFTQEDEGGDEEELTDRFPVNTKGCEHTHNHKPGGKDHDQSDHGKKNRRTGRPIKKNISYEDQYDQWLEGLTTAEGEVIVSYTGHDYDVIRECVTAGKAVQAGFQKLF